MQQCLQHSVKLCSNVSYWLSCVFLCVSIMSRKKKKSRTIGHMCNLGHTCKKKKIWFDHASPNFGTTAAVSSQEKKKTKIAFFKQTKKWLSLSQIHGRQFPVVTAVVGTTDWTRGGSGGGSRTTFQTRNNVPSRPSKLWRRLVRRMPTKSGTCKIKIEKLKRTGALENGFWD